MYSLFSHFDNFLTISEATEQTYVTANDLFTMRVNRMLGNIGKNLKYSQNYSPNYATSYYKQLRYQRKMDEILNAEYLIALKKGNTDFMKIYEQWRSETLFDYGQQPIYTYGNLKSSSYRIGQKVNVHSLLKEGKEENPGIPQFFKELILDFVICVAFFNKFLSIMRKER